MTTATNRIGRIGEELAARHLQRLGYTIVARNWRVRVEGVRGELDIVATDAGALVFCEVKTRRRALPGDQALAAVDRGKQRQLRRLAGLYLAERGGHGVDVRFDVVGVAWPVSGGAAELVHVRAAF
ncbi:MAG: YraN family protein [Actinomycetota bacterium]|jgi:putative endonuclease|nr:YraN family protein [Euzebyales bacterium]MDQ3342791.1 YraN family protein [Actinomycetota bacterium]MDQ3530737.1 YraN family protein [Actinomycetota bacterium]